MSKVDQNYRILAHKILETDEYAGIDSQGREVPTAHQMAAEKLRLMRRSIGIFSPKELDDHEAREMQILGQAMSQMVWLDVASDNPAFILGYTQGEGVIEELGGRTLDKFDGAVIYKVEVNDDSPSTQVVRLDTPARLSDFATAAVAELYRRGILV
jgi:hypothetical protein